MTTRAAKQPAALRWYDRRAANAGLAVAAALAGWALLLRAIDTGSLQQYFLLLVLIGFTINRLMWVVRGPARQSHGASRSGGHG